MTILRSLVFLALGISAQAVAADEVPADKRADIVKLLDITGSTAIAKQMAVAVVGQMSQAMKKMRPDIPQRVIDVLPGEVEVVFEANIGSFVEIMIPIYHKYFTAAEIKEMLRFYSTDLGKKTIQVMPALMNESMLAGQEWGRSLAPAIDQRVKARCKKEGFEL